MKEMPQTLSLSGKQNRFLRGLGHNLKPNVMIGRQHLSPEVIRATDDALATHELIKVKIQEGCLEDRRTVAAELAAATGSAVAQLLGKTFLLYRPADEPVIKLP